MRRTIIPALPKVKRGGSTPTKIFILVGVFVFFTAFLNSQFSIFNSDPAQAAAGINSQINFQGKLVNSNGTNIPNGTYNLQFKIYQDGDGLTAGNTTGSPAGSLKWTESRLRNNTQGVTVTDGIFQVNLGSVNPFGSSIDWNQDTIWLSINIGNTNATCTPFTNCVPDGEMLPMIRFTATPYASNAGALSGLTSSQFVQLAQGVQADSSTASSIFLNKTGATGNIVQLQDAGTDTFVISNSGTTAINTNSTTALTVQNGSNNAFVVDTTSIEVGIGVANPTTRLSIAGQGLANGITLGDGASGSANLYVDSNDTLKTDDSLIVAGSTTLQSTLDVTGSTAFKKGTDYSTTGALTDVNFGEVSLIRLTGSSTQTVNSIAGGRDGEILTIVNAAGQAAIVLNDDGATGTAGMRILTGTGANLTLAVNASMTLVYDSGASRWRVVGGVSTTLQAAYDGGNAITTTDGRNLSVTLANTTTDANLIVNVATGSTGEFKVQANNTDVLQIGAAGQLQLDAQGSAGGILIGGDANLYRSAVDELKTDDAFVVGNTATRQFSRALPTTVGNYIEVFSMPIVTGSAVLDVAVTTSGAGGITSVSKTYKIPLNYEETGLSGGVVKMFASDSFGQETGFEGTSDFELEGWRDSTNTRYIFRLKRTIGTGARTAQVVLRSTEQALTTVTAMSGTGASTSTASSTIRLASTVGQVGIGIQGAALAKLHVQSTSNAVTQILQGSSGQTADIFQVQNSAGAILTAFQADGKLAFGPSGSQDTNLYRSAADTLKTDDSLIVGTIGTGGTNLLCYDGTNKLSTCSGGPGSGSYIFNGTALQTSANFNIQAANSGVNGTVGGIIRGAAGGQTVDLLQLQASNGAVLVNVGAAGGVRVAVGAVYTGGDIGFTGTDAETGLYTTDAGAHTMYFDHRGGNAASDWSWRQGGTAIARLSASSGLSVYPTSSVSDIWGALRVGSFANTAGNGNLSVGAITANQVALISRGFASQTADLLQLQGSTGAVLSHFDANGNLAIGTSSAPTTQLYVVGGTVHTGIATPSQPTVTNQGTAGSTSYTYAVTALTATGETAVSTVRQTTTGNATLDVTNFNRVTWTAVTGASGYNVYRTASSGSPSTTGRIQQLKRQYPDF